MIFEYTIECLHLFLDEKKETEFKMNSLNGREICLNLGVKRKKLSVA